MEKIAPRTEADMRRWLLKHAKVGEQYVLWIPKVHAFEGMVVAQGRYRLVAIYQHIVTFENSRGTKVSFPYYEAIHLLKGEKYTAGTYPGLAFREEEIRGIIQV